jgi:hypothetical protein
MGKISTPNTQPVAPTVPICEMYPVASNPKVCPGPFGDGLPRHYDSFTFTNTSGGTRCVAVDVSTG